MRWGREGGERGENLQISLVLAILSDLSNTITDSKDTEFSETYIEVTWGMASSEHENLLIYFYSSLAVIK